KVSAVTGKLDEALPRLDQAIALDPTLAPAFSLRGIIRKHQKTGDQGLSDFEAAIRLDPSLTEARVNRGILRFAAQDPAGSIEDFTAALAANPSLPDALFWRARARLTMQDTDASLADMSRFLELDPNHTDALTIRGMTYAGRKKDYEKAVADLSRIVELRPDDPLSYTRRAEVLTAKKDYEGALKDCAKAFELDPKAVSAFYHRGKILLETGKPAEALADFEACLAVDPGCPVLAMSGKARLRLGQLDLAIADLEAGLKAEPGSAEIQRDLTLALESRRKAGTIQKAKLGGAGLLALLAASLAFRRFRRKKAPPPSSAIPLSPPSPQAPDPQAPAAAAPLPVPGPASTGSFRVAPDFSQRGMPESAPAPHPLPRRQVLKWALPALGLAAAAAAYVGYARGMWGSGSSDLAGTTTSVTLEFSSQPESPDAPAAPEIRPEPEEPVSSRPAWEYAVAGVETRLKDIFDNRIDPLRDARTADKPSWADRTNWSEANNGDTYYFGVGTSSGIRMRELATMQAQTMAQTQLLTAMGRSKTRTARTPGSETTTTSVSGTLKGARPLDYYRDGQGTLSVLMTATASMNRPHAPTIGGPGPDQARTAPTEATAGNLEAR
ncbi:MAG: tetratricopeptide repeat protein, partial [Elusimicrobiota bacterium]